MKKKDSPLSPQQEAFVQAYRRNGRNQRQAYLEAYPKARSWSNPSTVDVKASELMRNGKVKVRLRELDASERDIRKERFDYIDQTLREFIEVGMDHLDPDRIRPADIIAASAALAKMHGVDAPRDDED